MLKSVTVTYLSEVPLTPKKIENKWAHIIMIGLCSWKRCRGKSKLSV